MTGPLKATASGRHVRRPAADTVWPWRRRSFSSTDGVARSSRRGSHGFTELLRMPAGRSIGVDLLGHGRRRSRTIREAYDDLTTRVVEASPDEPVDAIGFSLGAITLLRLAMAEPQRFNRLVLAGIGAVVVRRPTTRSTRRIVAALEGHGDPDDNLARMFVQYAGQPGNDIVALTAVMKRVRSPMRRRDAWRRRRARRWWSSVTETSPDPASRWSTRCPTRRCGPCATSTTSPRPSRSASSTRPSSSSTPFRRERRRSRVGGAARRRAGRHPHRDGVRARCRRLQRGRGRRIFAVKGRPADHPLIVHVAAAELLGDWAADDPAGRGSAG